MLMPPYDFFGDDSTCTALSFAVAWLSGLVAEIRPDGPARCPVCDAVMPGGGMAVMTAATPREERLWAKCPSCSSFYSTGPYDLRQEIEHTRTRPWGIVASGIAFNDSRAPLFDSILKSLRRFALPGGTLLDVGCSYGGFLEQARDAGYAVQGIDIVPEAVEYVKSRGIQCNQAGSVDDLNIPENSLDVITVLDCNYYWPSQIGEWRAIKRALAPGGVLAVRTVDTSWAVQTGLWLRRWFPAPGQRLCNKAVYDHRVSVPARSLFRILERLGFDVIYTSPRDAMPFRRNSVKVKAAYAIGHLLWRITGRNVSPGMVLIARKRTK